jgi:hypothetical protein
MPQYSWYWPKRNRTPPEDRQREELRRLLAVALHAAACASTMVTLEQIRRNVRAAVKLMPRMGSFSAGSGGQAFWSRRAAEDAVREQQGPRRRRRRSRGRATCLERDLDARMFRTRGRPIPSGRVAPDQALAFAVVLFVWGWLQLLVFCGWYPAMLSALTAGIYAFVYTPSKRWGPVSIWIGAIPGAIPPVMGWTTVTGELGAGGLALFAILATWQFPHFLSLAYMYQEDYARAGFRFLPEGDEEGKKTGLQIALGVCGVVAGQPGAHRLGFGRPGLLGRRRRGRPRLLVGRDPGRPTLHPPAGPGRLLRLHHLPARAVGPPGPRPPPQLTRSNPGRPPGPAPQLRLRQAQRAASPSSRRGVDGLCPAGPPSPPASAARSEPRLA